MTVEIKLKKKYRPSQVWYGHRRTHSGNSAKKVRRGNVALGGEPYDRTRHVLVVEGTGKRRWLHT